MQQLRTHRQYEEDRGYVSACTENPYQETTVTVNRQKLATVDKFVYLGSTLFRSMHIDDEIRARNAKASSAFGRLRSSVWGRKGVSLSTKLSVYKAIVLTTLL